MIIPNPNFRSIRADTHRRPPIPGRVRRTRLPGSRQGRSTREAAYYLVHPTPSLPHATRVSHLAVVATLYPRAEHERELL